MNYVQANQCKHTRSVALNKVRNAVYCLLLIQPHRNSQMVCTNFFAQMEKQHNQEIIHSPPTAICLLLRLLKHPEQKKVRNSIRTGRRATLGQDEST